MKNWKKAIALLTALTTVAASTSAFAAISTGSSVNFTEPGFATNYTNAATGEVVVTVNTETAGTEAGKQMSFLILDDGTNEDAITAENILYIDQQETGDTETVFDGKISLARLGESVTEMPEGSYPIKVGYTDSNGDFAIAEATMVVEAVITTYTIAFYDKSGTNVLQSGQVAENGTVTPPTADQNVTEGDKKYHFVGWAVKDGDGTLVNPIPNAIANVNYIAVYEEDTKYTATFLNDDGTTTFGTVQAYAGDKLTVPTGTLETKLTENAGKKMNFTGWIKSGDQAPTDIDTFEMPAAAVTFTAKFTEVDQHTAAFNARFIVDDQEVLVQNVSIYVGDPIVYPNTYPVPTKEHFTFLGWTKTQGKATPDANLGTMGDADVPVYACWEEDAKYTVTFYDADNTTPLKAFTNVYAGTAIEGVGTPEKDGFEFKGWATSANAEESAIVDVPATVEGNASYYPVFTEVQSQGTIITFVWGDVDSDGDVLPGDATAILSSFVGGTKVFGDFVIGEGVGTEVIWGDVDSDGDVLPGDATALLSSFVGGTKVFGDFVIGEEVQVQVD